MLELRKKLANYQEIFYMLFLLPMTGMTSMGLNSEDIIYLYVFAVATLFLLLKMAVTDFTWLEIVIMGGIHPIIRSEFPQKRGEDSDPHGYGNLRCEECESR